MISEQQTALCVSEKAENGGGSIGEYKLCPMEGSPAPYKNIQYMVVFRSVRNKAVDALCASFNRLTDLYPLAKGHRVTRGDGNAIVVDKGDLATKRIFVHVEQQVTVDEIIKNRYNRSLWPPKMDLLLRECVENMERLISAVVVCLGDGYLVSLTVSHIVADGAGVFYMLKQWASLCRQMLDTPTAIEVLPELPVSYDREYFWSQLARSPKDIHPYVDYVLRHKGNSNLGNVQRDFEKICGAGVAPLSDTLDTHILHLSTDGMTRLSNDFNVEGSEKSIHGAQIFYALLWQRYIVATCPSAQNKGSERDGKVEMPVLLNILHNIREMVCDAASYVGNAVTGVYVPQMPSALVQKPVIEMARYIKGHINRITPGAVVDITERAFDPKSDFMIRAMWLQKEFGTTMAISNVSRLPFSTLDFGLGAAAAMVCGTLPTEGLASWMPHVSEDSEGGVDIYFGLQQDVYLKLKGDEMLSKYAQFKN